jgi:hypothetical protein
MPHGLLSDPLHLRCDCDACRIVKELAELADTIDVPRPDVINTRRDAARFFKWLAHALVADGGSSGGPHGHG